MSYIDVLEDLARDSRKGGESLETIPVALHLENGVRILTEVEMPADLEDDEMLAALRADIHERQPTPYRTIGSVVFRVEAFRAIELL